VRKKTPGPPIDVHDVALGDPVFDTNSERWIIVKKLTRSGNVVFVIGDRSVPFTSKTEEVRVDAASCTRCWNPRQRKFGRNGDRRRKFWLP